MTQISLNIDDEIMTKVIEEANEKGFSPSNYIVLILDEHFNEQMEKEVKRKRFIRELWETAEPDETFVEPPDFQPEDFTLEPEENDFIGY